MDTINYIFWEEPSKRPWVSYPDTWAHIRHVGAFVDLSASKVPVPPADKAPPDSIVERTELPRTSDLN